MKEEYKKCTGTCGESLPLRSFATAGYKKGIKYYRSLCPACHYDSRKEYRMNRADEYRAWKDSLSCENCGYSKETHDDFSSYALEFHHDATDKSFSISDGYSYGLALEKLKREAKKCKVLCCRCHIEEHRKEMSVYTKYSEQKELQQKKLKHKKTLKMKKLKTK